MPYIMEAEERSSGAVEDPSSQSNDGLRPRRLRHAWASLLLGLAACADQGSQTIETVRVARFVGDVRSWGLSPERRFGLRRPTDTGAAQATGSGWSYVAPPGWTEREPAGMRVLDFVVGAEGECYLTVLNGDGGGLEANVQRWRKQLGLAALTSGELAGLERVPFLATEGTLVDFEGTWKGMSGSEERSSWGLLGVLALAEGKACFLKFTGPRSLVEQEREAFLALASSLAPSAASGRDPHGSTADTTPPMPPTSTGEAPSTQLQRAAGLAWNAPDGWQRANDKPFRVVTFRTPDGVECYVTLLGGDGGGTASNVARWAGQLGVEAGAAPAVVEEPLQILGGEGILVAIDGQLASPAGTEEPARMLAAMRQLGDRSVFVKMMGAAANVEASKDGFLQFVSSLRFAEEGGEAR